MKPLFWIILAVCVGAVGLRPQPRAGVDLPRSPGGVPTVTILGTHLSGPNHPTGPGFPADLALFPVDFDPESESNGEAPLVAVGGLTRSSRAGRVELQHAADATSPGRAAVATASPRCFPIRC